MPITQFASQRIVKGTAATLRARFVDQDGDPRTPGTVTVKVVRSDGTTLKVAGTATTLDADNNATVALTPSETALLDELTCTWTESAGAVVETVVDVCGGRYFTINEARTVDDVLKDTGKFPNEDIKRVRTEVELEVERITGRSFVPRYRLDQIESPTRVRPVQLSEVDIRAIRSVTVGGVAWAASTYQLTSAGRLAFGSDLSLESYQVANGPHQRGDLPVLVVVGYEYGWPSPPDDLKRAMLTRLRSKLIEGNTGIPDRATAVSLEGSTYTLSTPGMRGAMTGIPNVDSVYRDYTRADWKDDFAGSMRIA